MEEFEANPYVGVKLKRVTGKFDMLVWKDASRFEMKEKIDLKDKTTAAVHAVFEKLGIPRKTPVAKVAPFAADVDEDDVPDVGKDEL